MRTPSPKTTAALGCAALALVALTGCGSTATSAPGTSAAGSTAATAGRTVALDESADRTRITVGPGTTVRVDLHSTYWSAVTSSAPDRLAPAGAPATSASPSCRPGAGCGTVTTAFTALAAGSARLTAQRTSCGEAKPCPPDQQTFTVDVEVTP
ncbi:hypothetical protein AB0K51_30735 [Kitasatospora sp. NPDC049285]|uniref:hypothetical protein n=1 Tax=Kitasatospora sp. NPDC049285 TaxID=3157096 RepID=UPI003422FE20